MASSTSHPDSSRRTVRRLAFAGLIGAPAIWLAALQTGYTLAYQACDAQSRYWVTVPTAAAFVLAAGTVVLSIVGARRATASLPPQPMLAHLGVGIAALMVIVLAASLIAPLMLAPCD